MELESSVIQLQRSLIQFESCPIQLQRSFIELEGSPFELESSPIQLENSFINWVYVNFAFHINRHSKLVHQK